MVYGHGGEHVRAAFPAAAVGWALQAQRLDTGHALQQAMPTIADDQLVLILYGDVPLIQRETLDELVHLAGPHAMNLLTVELPDPTGYGRIVRDATGGVLKIVEQKDAKPLVAPTIPEVLGINDRVRLAEDETEYRRLRARALLQAGVALADPARIVPPA